MCTIAENIISKIYYCAQTCGKHTDLFVQVMVSQRQLDRFSHLLLLYIHATDIRIRHVRLLVSTERVALSEQRRNNERTHTYNMNGQTTREEFLLPCILHCTYFSIEIELSASGGNTSTRALETFCSATDALGLRSSRSIVLRIRT